MTDKSHQPGTAWALDACTLPIADRPLRQAEFDSLFATNVTGTEWVAPHHLRFALSGPTDLETVVRELAERESECCSFFTFTVTSSEPGQVLLDIEVPGTQAAVLDALANRATQVRSRS